jgi:hypothetical protein
MADRQHWRPVLFNCPRTGNMVQALLAEEPAGAGSRYEDAGTRYETVSCLACSGIHLVDPMNGRVLGAEFGGTR